MFGKKIVVAALALCLTLTCFTGCSKPAAPAPEPPAGTAAPTAAPEPAPQKVYTMQIGHAQPTTNPRHISLLEFEKMVEEKTKGGLQVEIFPAGQLGSEKEMLESVKMGTIQSLRGGQMDFLPKMLAFTLPFLAENTATLEKLLSSDFAKKVCEDAKKDNMIIVSLCDAGGFRNFSTNVRPIKTPADLKGLKMRSPGIITIDMTLQALGASCVTVPYNELYMALKTGVADGQENPFINVEGMKFFEVQKYFTELNYQFHPDPFYINLDFWNSLPAEYQTIIKDAAAEMCKINNKLIADNIDKARQTIINGGAEVIKLTEEERKAFKEAVQVVYNQFVEKGYISQAELQELLALTN